MIRSHAFRSDASRHAYERAVRPYQTQPARVTEADRAQLRRNALFVEILEREGLEAARAWLHADADTTPDTTRRNDQP